MDFHAHDVTKNYTKYKNQHVVKALIRWFIIIIIILITMLFLYREANI